MNSINASLSSEFLLTQTTSDSNTPSGSPGKPPSQGQGKEGAPAVSTGGGTSAYASLQGSQGQATTSGPNINATLGQALGATQDSTADSSLTGGTYDVQDTGGEDAPQIANIGLRLDQQVAGSKGNKGSDAGSGGQSEKGEVYIPSAAAGLQKGQFSTQLASSVTSAQDASSFTLKVDPSSTQSTSGTSTTESSTYVDANGAPAIPPGPNVFEMVEESTSLGSQLQEYQISQMVSSASAQNTILSQDYSKQISDINNYIQAKNSSNSKSSAAQAFSWIVNIAMLVVGTVTADPMLIAAGIAGCIMTADPKIAAGLTSALESMGIKPAAVASIMSTLIIVAATTVGTMGVGAIAEGALKGGAEAAIATTNDAAKAEVEDLVENTNALDVTEQLKSGAGKPTEKGPEETPSPTEEPTKGTEEPTEGTEEPTEGTDETPAPTEEPTEGTDETLSQKEEQDKELEETPALTEEPTEGTDETLAPKEEQEKELEETPALTEEPTETPSAKDEGSDQAISGDQLKAEGDSTTGALKAAPKKPPIDWGRAASALRSPEGRSAFAKGAMEGASKTVTEAPGKLATSLYEAPASLAKGAKSLYNLAGRFSEQCTSLGSKGLFEAGAEAGDSTTMAEKAVLQLKSVATKVVDNPLKALHIACDITMACLAATGSVEQYNATALKAVAQKKEADVLSSQAETTAMTASINLANAQIQQVLSDMNADIVGAGQVLSQMSYLSSETLGQMHGAA